MRASPNTLDLNEGESGSYSLSLALKPDADVTITASLEGDQCQLEPASLTFTPDNYDQSQAVLVTAIDDQIDEGDSQACLLSHTVTTTGALYAEASAEDVSVSIADDDTAGLEASPSLITVREGDASSTASFTVVLTSQPSGGTVTVTLTPAEAQIELAEAEAGPFSGTLALSFTPENWATPQQVFARALDDADEEALHMAPVGIVSASEEADEYDDLSTGITAYIEDDELAVFSVGQVEGAVPEGDSFSYQITPAAAPGQDVTLNVSAEGGQCALNTANPITFAAGSTDPVGIELAAVNDDASEGEHTCLILHSQTQSDDPAFNGLLVAALEVAISDDDIDLHVNLTDNQAEVVTGSTLTYVLTVSNDGLTDAEGAALFNAVPTGLDAYTWACTATAGAECPQPDGSGQIDHTLGSLAAGASLTYLIQAQVNAAPGTVIENAAEVGTPEGMTEITPEDNQDTDQTAVIARGQTPEDPGNDDNDDQNDDDEDDNDQSEPAPTGDGGQPDVTGLPPDLELPGLTGSSATMDGLSVDVEASADTAAPGDLITWVITITNARGEPAGPFSFSTSLPGGFSLDSWEADSGTLSAEGRLLNVTTSQLAPDGVYRLVLVTRFEVPEGAAALTAGDYCLTVSVKGAADTACLNSSLPGGLPSTGGRPVQPLYWLLIAGLGMGLAALAGALLRRRPRLPHLRL